MTGASQTLFEATSYGSQQEGLGLPAIGTDGTLYTVDRHCSPEDCGGTDATEGTYVVGVPVVGGSERFRAPLENDTWTDVTTCFGGDGTPASGQYHPWPSTMIIAGDGNVYFSYLTTDTATVRTHTDAQPYPDEAYPIFQQLVADVVAHDGPAALADIDALTQVVGSDPFGIGSYITSGQFDYAYNILALDAPQFAQICDRTATSTRALHVASLAPDGTLSDRVVNQWTGTSATTYAPQQAWPYYESSTTQTGPADVDIDGPYMITDRDQGAVYSWMEALDCAESVQTDAGCHSNVPAYHLTTMSSGAIASDTLWDQAGYGQSIATGLAAVRPVLQLEDGSVAGLFEFGANDALLVFDTAGHTEWSTTGFAPLRATNGGGLLAGGTSGTYVFSADGSVVNTVARQPEYESWSGHGYNQGSIVRVSFEWMLSAPSFWAYQNANPSDSRTAILPPDIFGIFATTYTVTGTSFRHVPVRIVPRDQAFWRDLMPDVFNNPLPGVEGVFFATIGGEPNPVNYCVLPAKLRGVINRPNDVGPQLLQESLDYDLNREQFWILRLFEKDRNFVDNILDYNCYPELFPNTYNSNSYGHGLLKATGGISLPKFPYLFPTLILDAYPGWTKPVPIELFDIQQ